jgi:hypothetical protein
MGQTTNQSQHPQSETVGHDLDPNADGDLTITANVAATQALVVAANSTDDQPLSVSVRWVDSSAGANEFLAESAADIGLDGVTNDWARLVRKGETAEVTFTSDAGAGTQNQINAFVDAHR